MMHSQYRPNSLFQTLTGFLANIYMKGMDEIILLHVAEQPHVPFLAGKCPHCPS